MASNEWLVRKLHEQDKKIEALSRGGTGVGHTSIAPGENLTVISDNGEVVLGAGGVEHVDGPTPATPSAPTLKLGFGTIETTWDGTFAEGEDEDGVPLTAPVDFDVVEVHCSTDPEEEEWGEDTMRGQIKTREGGTITVGGFDVDDEVFVCLIALAKTGKRSAPSATASLVIEGLDFSQLFTEIDAANATIKNAGEVLVTEQGTLDEKLTEVDGTLNDLGQDLQAVEDAQAQLNTDLTDVMKSVDGKNTITWNPSAPSKVSNPGKAVGDLWYRTSGNSIVGFWKWDGTDWVTQLLDKTTIPLIDIGAGTFGTMSGTRLQAGTVSTNMLAVGVGGNLLPDPKFLDPDMSAIRAGTSWTYKTVAGETCFERVMPNPGSTANLPLTDKLGNEYYLPAAPGIKVSLELDVSGPVSMYLYFYMSDGSLSAPGSSIQNNLADTSRRTAQFILEPDLYATSTAVVERFSVRVRQTSSSTTAPPGTVTRVFSARVSPMSGATVIENGAVSTQKLTADVLEVKNLKATSGQLDEAVINKLFSDVVVAKTSVANAFIGENAILTGAVTAPKITASEELWAKIAQFVKIRAEHIEADAIDGMVITGPTIQSGRSGRRWIGDPNGIRVINEDDDVRTHLSPDGSTFKGEVEADTLVVNEGAEFKGNNTLAKGAKLTLAAGVTDPTAPPTVQPYWDGLELSTQVDDVVGLAFDGTNYITARRDEGSPALIYRQSIRGYKINASSGAVTSFTCDFSSSPGSPDGNVSEVFGVTCIGSELFFLGRIGYNGAVWVTDLDGVFKRRFASPDIGYSATNPLTYRPGIGNDGTNLVIAQCSDAGSLVWKFVNKGTGEETGRVDRADATKSDITGVYVGNGDLGTKYVVAAKKSTATVQVFTTNGAATDYSWYTATNGSTGIVYVDGKWRTLDLSGVIHEYADRNTGDNSGDWWCAYRWYTDVNGDNIVGSGDYMTRIGPGARFTWPRRAGLRITGQPMPAGVEKLGPYLAKQNTTPTRTDYHSPPWWPETGKPRAHYYALPADWATKPVPVTTNTFPEAESSVLESASGTFQVKGDGSGHWGPITWHADGTITGPESSGQTVITPSAANTVTSVEVTFPAGRFKKAPEVSLTSYTTSPNQVSVGAWPISKDSFTLNVYSTTTAARRVGWQATDSQEA